MKWLLLLISAFSFTVATAQPRTHPFLDSLLTASGKPELLKVVKEPGTYRVQIIYTQINRDQKNKPSFTNYYFNYDPASYFNPASMVKMPLAFLALEKLNTQQVKGVNKYTTVLFDSSHPGQRPLYRDTSARNGMPTIAHFIKRAFLISENDPYNRLYQFMGQGPINRMLQSKGYSNTRITRQFMGYSEEGNRHTNAIRFVHPNGTVLHTQPAQYNTDSFDFRQRILLGNGHFNSRDSLIGTPFDFTKHNNLSLEDMQRMLQSVLFPNAVPPSQRFQLTKDDYKFLYRYLSQYPSETPDPKYDTAAFYDSYAKFFFRDSSRKMPAGVRVFNKVGWSYGFLTDVAYIADFKNKVEFMLAATVYVNSDGIINDGRYDYITTGHPFLYALGQTVYQYELERKKTRLPNLEQFRLKYEKRDPTDSRPPLLEVDN